VLLLITGILAGAEQSKTSQSNRNSGQFDYVTQVGIVFRNEDKQLRLEIKNPNLATHEEIVIVESSKPQKLARAAIDGKVSGNCSQGGINDEGGACYKLRAVSGKIHRDSSAFGIANAAGSFVIRSGGVIADLDSDRVEERFRVCASMEGLHLTVWSGRPLKGKRQWHRYYYLGYDLEPNCAEGESK